MWCKLFLLVFLCVTAIQAFEWQTLEQEVVATGEHDVVELVYPFEVGTNETVRIKEVKSSCGCAVVSGFKGATFQPNYKGDMKVSFFTSSRRGVQEKKVTVTVETGSGEQKTALTVRVVLPEVIKLSPETLLWKKISELGTSKTCMIQAVQGSCQIIGIDHAHIKEYKITHTPIPAGGVESLNLQIVPKENIFHSSAKLMVVTNHPVARYQRIPVRLLVRTPRPTIVRTSKDGQSNQSSEGEGSAVRLQSDASGLKWGTTTKQATSVNEVVTFQAVAESEGYQFMSVRERPLGQTVQASGAHDTMNAKILTISIKRIDKQVQNSVVRVEAMAPSGGVVVQDLKVTWPIVVKGTK